MTPRIYVTAHGHGEYLVHCPELGVERELLVTKREDHLAAAAEMVYNLTMRKLKHLREQQP